MIKKIFLIIFSFVLAQNVLMAQDQAVSEYYLSNLQQKVENSWIMPIKKDNKTAVVTFTLDKQGRVIDAKIARTSGNEEFDYEALMAIYKAAPFGEFSPNPLFTSLKLQFFFSSNFISVTRTDVSGDNEVNPNQIIEDVDFGPYLRNLGQKITTNWMQAPYNKDMSTIATFKISKDGSLSDLHIVKSSANKDFNTQSINAINSSAPFDFLPNELIEDSIQVQFGFFYSVLKDYNGNQYKTTFCLVDKDSSLIRDYQNYKKQVESVLWMNSPQIKYYHPKDIKLRLVIDKNGKVLYLAIKKSSGDLKFDNQILKLLKQASFPPIPGSLNRADIGLDYSLIRATDNKSNPFLENCVWLGAKGLIPTYTWD